MSDAGPPPPEPLREPAGPAERPGGRAVVAQALRDIRHSRGRDVPNSRPVPDWVRRFVWILDDAFPVPGAPGRRVGVDGLIAFVPVAGDAVGVVLGGIVVLVGVAAGVSIPTVLRMMLNVGIEAVVGLIPFVGAVFDLVYKANARNLVLIEADLADRARARRSSIRTLVAAVVVAVAVVVLLLAIVAGAIAVLVWLLARWF